MNLGKLSEKFYGVTEVLMQLAIVNLLWILFTICGLVAGGLFPATAALFAVSHEWLGKHKKEKIFRLFWSHYRTYFIRANVLGYLMAALGLFLWLDLKLCTYYGGLLFQLLHFGVLGLALLYILTFIYLFPVCVRYSLGPVKTLKFSLLFAVTHPIESLMMLLVVSLVFIASDYFASIIPFFSVSLVGFAVTWFASKVFPQVQTEV